ncbi:MULTISPECIES: XdhC family protein [Streptosporangium]|uniref:Xanthine dehydrogenase accessory factor n=1 Tax=Streptosporangium brasiliense TaxID=47480 RepID=A0ABT9RG05_9ACTN|nr:XdhC/CoxI family protein [Streptosporangium brasiliense]MDP9868185.1 xanthine dehydrogenase accessory factor [Streptosporangium brasiliense]
MDAGGEAVGSVSGGCVEGAVHELCQEVVRTGRPVRHTFGHSDADAFAVGLSCGGTIEVFVQPILPASSGTGDVTRPAVLAAALEAVRRGEPVAVARLVDGGTGVFAVFEDRVLGGHGVTDSLAEVVVAEARAMLDAGLTGLRTLGCGEEEAVVFVEAHTPPPRLLVFGAVDFAAALTRIGRFLGHHVTVCDARPAFVTSRRFPDAHEVVVDWPHRYLARTRVDRRTVVCVLTHDAKFDVPLLEVALRLPVAYVGAMGSRRTQQDRIARLREAGLRETELSRLCSPIGLDLGARTPEETALSIAGEFVALRRGGSGLPLAGTAGPIHPAGRAGPIRLPAHS